MRPPINCNNRLKYKRSLTLYEDYTPIIHKSQAIMYIYTIFLKYTDLYSIFAVMQCIFMYIYSYFYKNMQNIISNYRILKK